MPPILCLCRCLGSLCSPQDTAERQEEDGCEDIGLWALDAYQVGIPETDDRGHIFRRAPGTVDVSGYDDGAIPYRSHTGDLEEDFWVVIFVERLPQRILVGQIR